MSCLVILLYAYKITYVAMISEANEMPKDLKQTGTMMRGSSEKWQFPYS